MWACLGIITRACSSSDFNNENFAILALEWDLWFWISNKFLGNASAAGQGLLFDLKHSINIYSF